jgi:hypothetical protein
MHGHLYRRGNALQQQGKLTEAGKSYERARERLAGEKSKLDAAA